jgi:diketogulonate reductase-like aldo/keto reductase
MAAAAAGMMLPSQQVIGSEADGTVHRRAIPADGTLLPLIGLGSWLTFDAPPGDVQRRNTCADVMRAYFAAGGAMLDSSPMYGFSQDVIGAGLRKLDFPPGLFSATKVWIPGADLGERQMEYAREIWGVERFDLLYVHNMLDWQSHLRWLSRWRAEGRVRYIGITTSHGRRHEEMETVIREEDFDFVQFTYNIAEREAEQRLLPLAAEHGKAVVINRPFNGGALFGAVEGSPLPDWAAEIDCRNWAHYFLKFVVSHPAVTCAIPATSRVDHVDENTEVLRGRLPSPEMREEMTRYFRSIA